MTALALTREVERGTMENLLAMPARPYEIMIGKIVPYIGFGLLQVGVILIAAKILFSVPMEGPMIVLFTATLLFIAANVTLGYTFSTIVPHAVAGDADVAYSFLPSHSPVRLHVSLRGMPVWAQYLGEALPLTHYIRIVRAIMLKGAAPSNLQYDTIALIALMLIAMTIAVTRFRRTLD